MCKIIKSKCIILLFVLIQILFITTSSLALPLELGDRGDKVLTAQENLNKVGYDIKADGIYGKNTEEIIKLFQYNNGLKVDGILGSQTYNTLKRISQEVSYEVKPGDTLSGIAVKYNTKSNKIIEYNNLKSDIIHPGQTLIIPSTGDGGILDNSSNIFHKVRLGDSLSVIAHRYGVDLETIKLANNLRSNTIVVGQNLLIPIDSPHYSQSFTLREGSLIWPVIGRISCGYGYRNHPVRGERHFHAGIDIAVPAGTEIRAAAPGKVVESNYMGGYGKTIVVDHGNGVETLYAHNSRLLVNKGYQVKRGEVIAFAGSTGLSTGPHLHFEIRTNDETINPFNYLP